MKTQPVTLVPSQGRLPGNVNVKITKCDMMRQEAFKKIIIMIYNYIRLNQDAEDRHSLLYKSPALRAAPFPKGGIFSPPFDKGGQEGFLTLSHKVYECFAFWFRTL